MSEKKYYWLKLEKDYLTSPKIKKLRKIAGGDTFTIIYLKMLLQSTSEGGIITFEGIENTVAEELALKLDEQLEDVQMTLAYLDAQGLIEKNDDKFLLPEASNRIGSESDSAERVRRFREKQKMLQCNGCVTDVKQISISNYNSNSISNSIVDKEEKIKEYDGIQSNTVVANASKCHQEQPNASGVSNYEVLNVGNAKQRHQYGEYKNVLLTDEQYENLKAKFPLDYEEKIRNLDEGIELKGYKYKNHYLAILKWASKDNHKQETDLQRAYKRLVENG